MGKKIEDQSLYVLTQFLDLDIDKGEMSLFNQRVGLFPLKSVLEIFSVLKDEMGLEDAENIIYKTGIKFGKNLVESIMELGDNDYIDLNPLQGRDSIAKILSFCGLGKIQYTTYEKKNKSILKYYNSPVIETKDNLFCVFIVGLLKSVLSLIYEKEVTVEEKECSLRKSKCCTFEISF